jgi:hypothetical protein
MRVRVRFRYNAETGEVEAFVVEDVGGTRHGRDHDAVHDAVTSDVARIIEQNALIEEVPQGQMPAPPRRIQRPADEATAERPAQRLDE